MTITLKDVGSGFKRTAINENFDTIETELNTNVLKKDGSQQLEADLDFNSNRGINLEDGVLNSDAVNLGQLNGAISAAGSGLVISQIETQLGSAAVSRVFTFSGITYTIGANNLEVYRNGQRLEKTEDYSETSTSSITLTFDPNSSDRFVFRTNTATTNSTTTTAAITHSRDGIVHNLSTYLNSGVIFGDSGNLLEFKSNFFRPNLDDTIELGTSSFRWSNGYITELNPGDGTVKWTSGSGTPEGVVTAPVGSMFTRTDGGASTTLYVKESGSGNTGWVAK